MADIDHKKLAELEQRYDPAMQFRQIGAVAKYLVVALLFSLSIFHYYTAGFGLLEHYWHVSVHLAFVLGLIYLVYTAHQATGAAGAIAIPAARPQIRWPDLIKAGTAAVFVSAMLGFWIGVALFVGYVTFVHFSRRWQALRGVHGETCDHVLALTLGLFCLHMLGQATGLVGQNLWGSQGAPPPVRLGLAMMMLVLVFEARRRVPVIFVLFAGAAYYFTGGLGVFDAGLEGHGLGAVTVTSVVVLAIALEPVFRLRPVLSSAEKKARDAARGGGVPVYDWVLFAVIGVASLYVAVTYDGFMGVLDELNFRIGDPTMLDTLMGTAMVAIVIEASRRTSGISLPIITILFIMYALFGRYFDYPLIHPGTSWAALIDHLYLKGEGVNGRPVFVIATYVFHFVLFGMVAIRVGLGQLFIDLAQCIAGRYSGGPAKVSVLASGMMGMISGSSIANTVMTGSLTIPTMKRIGYKAHFAGAVEAAASTGGQITPPIMGSAAFLMVEFLEIPLRDIILAAIVPASMHYLAVLVMVHFEAKRLGLRGLTKDEMPVLLDVLSRGWLTLLPFFLIIYMIFVGHTPYWAAFWAITACLAMGFAHTIVRWALKRFLGIAEERSVRYLGCKAMDIEGFVDAFQMGGKYALSVGAAAATVGIIIGVLTVTGTPFNIANVVNTFATDIGQLITLFDPTGLLTVQGATLFLSLVLVAISCIVMGAGLPTTATYLVLATMATPALMVLGVDSLTTHFFVFYYGVLADITPPVALAAYAAATIAQADLMKTGNTAFRLGMAKALVPFVFVYAPSMLIVVEGFNGEEFIIATVGCAIGIVLMGSALTGYLVHTMEKWHQWLLGAGALLIIAPGVPSGIVGLAAATPVLLLQFVGWRRRNAAGPIAQPAELAEPVDPSE